VVGRIFGETRPRTDVASVSEWLCFAQRSRKPLWYTHFRMDLVLSQEPWARICTRQPSHYRLPGLRPETSEGHEPVIVKAVGQLRPQHFLYFLPEPQGHGSLRPALPVGVQKDDGCVTKSCVEA
jgi:hypothetical protein